MNTENYDFSGLLHLEDKVRTKARLVEDTLSHRLVFTGQWFSLQANPQFRNFVEGEVIGSSRSIWKKDSLLIFLAQMAVGDPLWVMNWF